MESPISDIAFTDSVKSVQERNGSRHMYAKLEQRGGWNDVVTPDLAAFIQERDSFYLGTASADGRPYIQHRGGPRGFLKVLDENTPPSPTSAATGSTSPPATWPRMTGRFSF